jgi:hypothetical protein
VVEKMGEEEFIAKTSKLHERRQTLQVKNAYRLRKDSMARLKVCCSRLIAEAIDCAKDVCKHRWMLRGLPTEGTSVACAGCAVCSVYRSCVSCACLCACVWEALLVHSRKRV